MFKLRMFLTCVALVLVSAAVSAQAPSKVLVVANAQNSNSVKLAKYYMAVRSIPSQNLLQVNWSADDGAEGVQWSYAYPNLIQPILQRAAQLSVDYVVLCRNLPTTITDNGCSLDSAIACKATGWSLANPYSGAPGHFSSSKYNMYLVTRLDGWSWLDAKRLVIRSAAAIPWSCYPSGFGYGTFLIDEDPTRNANPSYGVYNTYMDWAYLQTMRFGAPGKLDTTNTFQSTPALLGGYFSWGSNDAHFSPTAFQSLSFIPGALADTCVSTSASNMRYPGGWQSQIGMLIQQGVTGVKGYVTEPYLSAVSRPDVLFCRTLSGYNLAESFYAASLYVGWKDVVVGDPLCNPYGDPGFGLSHQYYLSDQFTF